MQHETELGADPRDAVRRRDAPSNGEVRAQLDRIVASPDFAQSDRLRRFLSHIVSETLAGREAKLKEYAIAIEVFDRDDSFDPQTSSIVRVEASRLRGRLDKYHATVGRDDPVRITVPPGSYVPHFHKVADVADDTESVLPEPRRDGRWRMPGRALTAMGVVVVGVAIFWALVRLGPDPRQTTDPTTAATSQAASIAVLPLRNLSGDRAQDYFNDGLTEALIANLAKQGQFPVISRTSVMVYKDVDRPIREIARELGVSHVVEGAVLRVDDQVRINAQLIEAETDRLLWAESYARDITNVLTLQDEVVNRIVASLAGRVAAPAVAPASPAVDPAAYEAQLKARYFRNQMTAEGFTKSIAYFQEAIDREPGYALAHAGMASCYCLLSGQGFELVRPHDAMPAAKREIEKALALDRSLVEPYVFLGFIKLKYDWDWPGAEQTLRRAIELDKNHSQARLFYSIYLEAMGRQAEAVREAVFGLRTDPLSLSMNVNMGWQFMQAGRLDEARRAFEDTAELNPDFWGAHWGLGHYHQRRGDFDAAIAAFQRAISAGGGHTLPLKDLGYTLAISGKPTEARNVLDQLAAMALDSYVSPYNMAVVHGGLGEPDAAFDWLDKAFEERSRSLAWLNVAPDLTGLRADPRFRDLVRRVGLPILDAETP